MKRYIILAIAICSFLAFSCEKESSIYNDTIPPQETIAVNSPLIVGIIDNEDTKTTYDVDGKFSWVANDKIAVQIVNGDNYSSHLFKSASSAAETTFSVNSEAIPDGYSIGEYAFYPADLKYTDSYKTLYDLTYNNDNPVTVTLPALTNDYIISALSNKDPMQMVPLVGKKQSESEGVVTYKFVSATGFIAVH